MTRGFRVLGAFDSSPMMPDPAKKMDRVSEQIDSRFTEEVWKRLFDEWYCPNSSRLGACYLALLQEISWSQSSEHESQYVIGLSIVLGLDELSTETNLDVVFSRIACTRRVDSSLSRSFRFIIAAVDKIAFIARRPQS
jgi:hypothetical protein